MKSHYTFYIMDKKFRTQLIELMKRDRVFNYLDLPTRLLNLIIEIYGIEAVKFIVDTTEVKNESIG